MNHPRSLQHPRVAQWLIPLENYLGEHTLAGLALRGFTLFLLLSSLAQLGLGVAWRLEGGPWLAAAAKEDPLYELGTSLGFFGSVYFALNFILATRWRWVEQLLGGLDKVYQTHAFLGRATLTMVLLHVGLLALQALPDNQKLAQYLVPGADWAYTLGLVGTTLLSLLVLLTIWVRLRYQTWLSTHKWMGIPFVAGNLHAIVLQADWYMVLMTLVGGYAWLYNLSLYRRLAPRHSGEVVEVNPRGQITELTLALDPAFSSQPGQFIFLSISRSASGLGSELHPFSISAQQGSNIRLSAKQTGDFTRRLPSLKPGDQVQVFGPHGHLGQTFLHSQQPMLWVAGGIGLTPFLGLLHHEVRQPQANRPIHLVWSVSRPEDAIYRDELEQLAQHLPHFSFQIHCTQTEGRLEGSQLASKHGASFLTHTQVFLCGPSRMSQTLIRQLRRLGKNRRDLISETFALRP
jgi:predicted ferric reductase